MSEPTNTFEPILLDLSDVRDYAVVVNALDEWADRLEHDAEDEEQRIGYNELPGDQSDAPRLRAEAERARALRGEIERQLDLNSAARRAIDDAES